MTAFVIILTLVAVVLLATMVTGAIRSGNEALEEREREMRERLTR